MQTWALGIPEVINQLIAIGESKRAKKLTGLYELLSVRELQVTIFGEFNRGKSTLINALLGRVVLPAKLIPTTGHITRVVFGSNEEVHVHHLDGRIDKHRLDQLDSFSSLNGQGLAQEDIDVIEVAVDNPLLKSNLTFIDTPGVNERAAQTRRAVTAIEKADLVLFVLDARQLLNNQERSFAIDWLSKELGKSIVPIVNFMNFLSETERQEVLARLREWCKNHLRTELDKPWYEVNALGALAYAIGRAPAPDDDFFRLRQALEKCQKKEGRNLQDRNRRSQLLVEIRKAQEENGRTLQRIRENAASVEKERVNLRHEMNELRRRFDANAATECDRVVLFGQHALNEGFNTLLRWFAGESGERLESYANNWYSGRLSEAVRLIEKEADAALVKLAGETLSRPTSFTITERMTLNAQLQVGYLSSVDAADSTVGWGAGIGAALGTVALPIIGTAVGAIVGGWIANVFGSTKPDYVAAYSAKAREQWNTDARTVINILQGQFDARITELRHDMDLRLAQASSLSIEAQSITTEMQQRECLKSLVKDCEKRLMAN